MSDSPTGAPGGRKKKSGAFYRRQRREQEEAAGVVEDAADGEEESVEVALSAPGRTGAGKQLAAFDPAVQEQLDRLGPPPIADPLRLIVWLNQLAGIAAWAYAVGRIGPGQTSRLRGMLESIRSGGMTSSKAVERQLQRKVAKKVGLIEESKNDGLDAYPRRNAAVVGEA